MPQLHHRDPAIIGLLGASPHISSPNPISAHLPCNLADPPAFDISAAGSGTHTPDHPNPLNPQEGSEALEHSPKRKGGFGALPVSGGHSLKTKVSRPALHLDKGQIADMPFERPFYGLIVDGIHCHPNSVRVCFMNTERNCLRD